MRWLLAAIIAVLTASMVGMGLWLLSGQPPRFVAVVDPSLPQGERREKADPPRENIIDGTADDDILVGTEGPDRITGGPGSDRLAGLGGDDRLYAAGADPDGADTVSGGAGNDRIYIDASDVVDGGEGHDQLVIRGSKGYTIDLARSSIEEPWGTTGDDVFDGSGVGGIELVIHSGPGNDKVMGGNGNDRLFGGDNNDRLEGGGGDDVLSGEAGDDTLTGGAGADVLTGGPGADTFVAGPYDGSTDIISDYAASEGDVVSGGSFEVVDGDTLVLDADGNQLFRLAGYDANRQGVRGR